MKFHELKDGAFFRFCVEGEGGEAILLKKIFFRGQEWIGAGPPLFHPSRKATDEEKKMNVEVL